jgi:hypothetical protein
MSALSNKFTLARRTRHERAAARSRRMGVNMSSVHTTKNQRRRRQRGRVAAALLTFVAPTFLALAALLGFSTDAALACACGCSVFDVGGLDSPQEQDHGGRVFFEFWSGDQTENYVGSSKASSALNTDKEINTQWYNAGFEYMFNRQWGVMVRVPFTNRALTTQTDFAFPDEIQTFHSMSVGDIELMGIYTGFFPDMSTGVTFGIKLPSGTFTAPGIDRDTQIGSGSTDLLLGAFHRGLLTGDNAWQYFMQVAYRQPFLYQSAADPQGFFDGNLGVIQTYYPGMQVDGAAGIVYNNLYHVLGFDKITPLAQVIVSHRNPDSGSGADPFNSGFDRVMLSPGIEFTKVVDEANNRVLKTYFDIEVPIYYRANAACNGAVLPLPCGTVPGVSANGTEGQLVAPYLIRLVESYNF